MVSKDKKIICVLPARGTDGETSEQQLHNYFCFSTLLKFKLAFRPASSILECSHVSSHVVPIHPSSQAPSPPLCLKLVGLPSPQQSPLFMTHVPPFHCIPSFLPQKFTSVWVILVIKSELQNPAEVKGKPAEGKHENQAEDCFGHFSSLKQDHKRL